MTVQHMHTATHIMQLAHTCVGRLASGNRQYAEGGFHLAANIDSAVRGSSHGQQGSTVLLGLDDLQALEGGHIPHPNVAPGSAVQARPADGNALHRLLVPSERVQALALPCIPHLPGAAAPLTLLDCCVPS